MADSNYPQLTAVKYYAGDGIYIDRVTQMDGAFKWAIHDGLDSVLCLNKQGEWIHEPFPSARSDDLRANTRFDSVESAYEFLQAQGYIKQ